MFITSFDRAVLILPIPLHPMQHSSPSHWHHLG
jgi:hypothetical protein